MVTLLVTIRRCLAVKLELMAPERSRPQNAAWTNSDYLSTDLSVLLLSIPWKR